MQRGEEEDTSLDDGPLTDRRCTDVIFLIILVLYLAGMVYVAYIGISKGDPYKMIYGVDSWGNICNRKNEPIPGAPMSGRNMIGKVKKFYFDQTYFTSQINTGLPVLDESIYISTCVSGCPNDTLLDRSAIDEFRNTSGINLCRYDTMSYVSDNQLCPTPPITKHMSVFNRCIPEALVNLAATMARSFTSVLSSVTVGGDISVSIIIVACFGFLAAFIIWFIVIAVIAFCLGATAYCWYSWYNLKMAYDSLAASQQTADRSDAVETWLIYACIASGITVVQLFKEAGKAIRCIPFLLLQPLWTLIILGGVLAGLAAIAAYIETSGNIVVAVSFSDIYVLEIPEVNNSTGIVKYAMDDTMRYLRWYHIFGILWVSAFIVACQDMVIAGAIATWFFKRDKSQLGWPVLASIKRLIRYHLGSVAFGSFIIALVRLARMVLGYIQNKLRGKVGKVTDFLLKMLQCCLWCFEKFLAYLNRNAYIEIAIYGYSFCRGAQKAFLLIVSNALRVAAINSIGDFVLFLGKISTMAIVLVIGHEFLKHRDDINFMWAPITVAAAFGFAVSHCFLLVYEVAIDTIFLCFCEDCERNDGVSKPYYMSKDLMKYLNDSNKMIAKDEQTKTNKKEGIDLANV
ncbi:choline transporter-like protein 1 [Mytilus californianus]|uniref:choline transporter-like protein 1 n=1 Tax=Mytilus californianus TaxID=6549 RepID=UPI0022451C03|nr:choline transporter-like protein 1 [Mytilus californianus]